ncbi:MAG: HAMP domain-containing histidine kinase [Erysipelotrichaceae bacterium]|nr:HAMP domain-containing histidine kinase [Erysipelotrichaceae bacterium]
MKKSKKIIISYVLIILSFIVAFNIFYIKLNDKNRIRYNQTLNSIIYQVSIKYPLVNNKDIIEILDGKVISKNVLKKYGIDIDNDYLILNSKKDYIQGLIINNTIIIIFIILFILISFINKKNQSKKIKEITDLIEQINRKNYYLNIDNNTEDELSILKNEIYKTTIMLKEEAYNSNKDKDNIKKSIEDISHQLKTPLTSISIMLDNIIDDPDMDANVRSDFINDINREINNINFLVKSLLKLSRFDINAVNYNSQNNSVKSIMDKVMNNVSTLSDLKNIKVNINIQDDFNLYCDFNWQVEALTNIVKNSIEHSFKDKNIIINASDEKLYSKIEITNYGIGINDKDIKHIFDRFYKGENSNEDSFGIGLSLAKTIIEKNNGKISVLSKKNDKTTFTIKYYKY